ncbi:MAG: AraC family transcriptional regulator [Muribaculaceae bacterium]|nr:AraC family transcriptional regulator [Muribaculaceae bacterium]
MPATADNILTLDKIQLIFPEAVTLAEGLLFEPFPQTSLEKMMLNEGVMIIGFVKSGSVGFKINGTEYKAQSGDIIVVNPGDITESFSPGKSCNGYLIACSVNRTIELIKDLDFYRLMQTLRATCVVSLSPNSFDNILSIISVIEKISLNNKKYNLKSLSCLHLTEAIACELYEGIVQTTSLQPIAPSRPEAIYREFMELLSKSSIHQRDVKWYADKLCISPKYLSRVCNICSGRSASDWIREYVMYDIRIHLKNSSMSIKEVAHRLGFSSLTFFGKTVRRWFGITPSELRAQLRKQKL